MGDGFEMFTHTHTESVVELVKFSEPYMHVARMNIVRGVELKTVAGRITMWMYLQLNTPWQYERSLSRNCVVSPQWI